MESIRALARGFEVRTCVVDEVLGMKCGINQVLLASGATHPVIPYREGLSGLEQVSVTLAGDERQKWLRTRGGTLVVPPAPSEAKTKPPQAILPLGSAR